MRFKSINNKGVSLALTIGLFLMLIIIATTVNELVIRALRASHQIEASDKAYFAAEAGIEDALYELSLQDAGYETSDLGSTEVHKSDFTQTVPWKNEWEIKNKALNDCDDLEDWEGGFEPSYCGKLYGNQKLVINLFTDNTTATGIETNEINSTPADISRLNISHLEIKFRLPKDLVNKNNLTNVTIDNDQDYNLESGSGLNEDGQEEFGYPPNACKYSDGQAIKDNDCDLREDEDSLEDPVILWKLLDEKGNTFQPLRGCKGDPSHFSHNDLNAGLCEKNFTDLGNGELTLGLTDQDRGTDQSGNLLDLNTFIGKLDVTNKLKIELLVVAPMEIIDAAEQKRIPVPAYEYGVEYEAGGTEIPSTFFSIRSDGFYRDFKQSITTNVLPGATSRLLDITIIQQ